MDIKKNEPPIESQKQNSKKVIPSATKLVPTQSKPTHGVVKGKPNQKENSGPSETKKKLDMKPKTQDPLAKTNVKVKETKPKKQ